MILKGYLILSCRSGWPYPLAEILVRYGRYASLFHQWLICLALGEIASAPHKSKCAFTWRDGRVRRIGLCDSRRASRSSGHS